MAASVDRAQLIPLIVAAQTGDASAIGRLLQVCQADARRYAYRHCRASDIDDAVQESLMIIVRKLGGLQAVVAFSSWLFTIIKRECLRLGRALMPYTPLDEVTPEQQLAHKSDDALRMDLAAALESLPIHYLEVVILRDFEELTITEIAERLAEPASTVKSRLHRARVLVREYLLSYDSR